MRTAFALISVVLLATLPANAQDLERPANWKVRFDRSGTPDTAVYFVTMPPGWHVTTGPAAILYDPAKTASGAFRITSEIFLFDPGRRHREAYGVLFGGQDLGGTEQSYTYFLIRDTGEFLVKRRDGSGTTTVRPWTASAAIMKHPGGEKNAKNVLAVEARGDAVDFFINGEKVVTVPRGEIRVDGVVGLRVNHSLNLHVTSLTVERLGAGEGR